MRKGIKMSGNRLNAGGPDSLYKLGVLKSDDQWVEHIHSATYEIQDRGSGQARLFAGVPKGDPSVFEHLVLTLRPPYALLYILHTTRGEGDEGRYQSPEITQDQFRQFIEKYEPYLSGDGRFDIWARSMPEAATVVWDRHNQIYAYGPLERYADKLMELGFAVGKVDNPGPHEHYYRHEFDLKAQAILRELDWSFSPLRPEDEQ